MRAVAVAVAGRPPTHVASPRALTRARGSIARPPRATEKDADADAPLSARVAAPDVKKKKDVDDDDDASIAASMAAARACEASGMSPGAGLSSAEDQAEAAFADMINTTVDVTGEALDADARARLAEGGAHGRRVDEQEERRDVERRSRFVRRVGEGRAHRAAEERKGVTRRRAGDGTNDASRAPSSIASDENLC